LPGGIILAAISVKNWRFLRDPSRYWVWLTIFALSLIYLWLDNDSRTWEWWWD
jgi:hypothetical protein